MSSDEHHESGTVHWFHPRWHGEEPLFKVHPPGPLNEYYIAKKLGPETAGVRGRWWYVEEGDEIEKRAEVIGYRTPVPSWVRDTLLGYENENYGPIERVLNPVDDDYHDEAADELPDEQQELVTDGGQHMAGDGYSDRFEQSPDDLPDGERFWWCDACGAVFDRHHASRGDHFCNNCEQRDAVLISCVPVGPGADKVYGEVA